jgi:hypothetical protein
LIQHQYNVLHGQYFTDHMGRVKQPCCIGSANNKGLKPICEKCGLGCYSILVAQEIKGNN